MCKSIWKGNAMNSILELKKIYIWALSLSTNRGQDVVGHISEKEKRAKGVL